MLTRPISELVSAPPAQPRLELSLTAGNSIAMYLPNTIPLTLVAGSSGSLATFNTYFYK